MPSSSPRPVCSAFRMASAAPTAWRHWEPVGLEVVKMWMRASDQWLGICRPPVAGSSLEPTEARNMSLALTPRP